MTKSDKVGIGVITFLVLFLLYMVGMLIALERARPVCLSSGYSTTDVTWSYKTYCSRLWDATDDVVPLSEL